MAMCVIAVVGEAPCQCFSPGGNQDHVTGPDLLDRPSPALDPAATRSHEQSLAQRVGVPCGPCAGLEGDADAKRACRLACLEQRVNAYGAGEILGRSFAGRL